MRAAGVLLAAALLSSVAPLDAQTQEGVAQARFNKGRELFIANQFAPALVELRAATALYESPNTRLYIARCERELGHVAAAFVEFQRAANEAADRAGADPRYASTRDNARLEGSALSSKLAHVTVVAPKLPDGAEITINGTPLNPAGVGVEGPVDPGTIEVIATAPGYLRLHKTARAAAGDSVEMKLQFEKESVSTTGGSTEAVGGEASQTKNESPDETPNDKGVPGPSHGLRNAGFVVGGIGIAGLGVFGAFAGLAQSRFDQLKTQCGGAPCAPSFQSQIDEGQMFQTIANVALAGGGALLITGVIMVIAGASGSSPSPVQASFAPLLGGGWMAGVGRTF